MITSWALAGNTLALQFNIEKHLGESTILHTNRISNIRSSIESGVIPMLYFLGGGLRDSETRAALKVSSTTTLVVVALGKLKRAIAWGAHNKQHSREEDKIKVIATRNNEKSGTPAGSP